VGQSVRVLVLSEEKGRINLSIKKALPQRAPGPRGGGSRSAPARRPAPAQPLTPDQAFEDKLKRFLSSSEGKMADLNRGLEGKRGGGRRRR